LLIKKKINYKKIVICLINKLTLASYIIITFILQALRDKVGLFSNYQLFKNNTSSYFFYKKILKKKNRTLPSGSGPGGNNNKKIIIFIFILIFLYIVYILLKNYYPVFQDLFSTLIEKLEPFFEKKIEFNDENTIINSDQKITDLSYNKKT